MCRICEAPGKTGSAAGPDTIAAAVLECPLIRAALFKRLWYTDHEEIGRFNPALRAEAERITALLERLTRAAPPGRQSASSHL